MKNTPRTLGVKLVESAIWKIGIPKASNIYHGCTCNIYGDFCVLLSFLIF
jgi:hypothetical protein